MMVAWQWACMIGNFICTRHSSTAQRLPLLQHSSFFIFSYIKRECIWCNYCRSIEQRPTVGLPSGYLYSLTMMDYCSFFTWPTANQIRITRYRNVYTIITASSTNCERLGHVCVLSKGHNTDRSMRRIHWSLAVPGASQNQTQYYNPTIPCSVHPLKHAWLRYRIEP